MPLRDMLRDGNKLQTFRETGTIEGVSAVVVPTPGLPPRARRLAAPAASEHVSLDVVRPGGVAIHTT